MVTGRDFISMIDYAIRETIQHTRFWFPHYSKFERRVKEGVTLYTKPKKNNNSYRYNNINFNRRITSKRVFTHTKK